MKKLYSGTILLLISLFCITNLHAENKIVAFPGAEGFGKYATGGRGGRVVKVTSLEDYSESGTPIDGSLRQALKTSGDDPITIVFEVSGRIDLVERMKCGRSNMTIAGQTSPGDGICISGNNIYFSGKNFIIRHLRFRTGDEQRTNASCINVENAENFIIDHCSFSWSIEENMTLYDNINSTVQWCIISEPLYKSYHPKGSRGYGMQWGGQYASYHHNLIAHAYSRAPRVNGSRAHDTMSVNDFVNNVIYNWGKKNSVYGGEVELADGQCLINWINNYYKPGPASPSNSYIAEVSYTNNELYGKWYVNGNYFDNASYAAVNEDNTKGMNYKGGEDNNRSDVRFDVEDVTTTTAAEAYNDVLESAGARIPRLDAIDKRIIAEAKGTLTPVYGGALGATKGIIDTQTTVGGWPEYSTAEAPIDSDGDGIPDEWETENGLNPSDPSDGMLITSNGYSNLENYINNIESQTTSVKDTPQTVSRVYFDAGDQKLHVNSDNTISKVSILQLNGAVISTTTVNNTSAYIQLNNLGQGIYLVAVYINSNKPEYHKIIK